MSTCTPRGASDERLPLVALRPRPPREQPSRHRRLRAAAWLLTIALATIEFLGVIVVLALAAR